ncbi:MAG: hypothetical protein VYB48_09320 [Pseudomonadota bacterium]|nr:hypothetical protein [Pseudomonadota bacterium]MEC8103329.1 hypothetical protein [Pseudomonadota bacterium]MEC8524751.1 hypothetical protein [Pseudomonadota bacterium]
MQTRLLTYDEFKETQMSPKRVEDSQPTDDFWDYVAAIPAEDFGIFDCREGQVTHVYRMGDQYEHVLINSQYEGVAMVIVISLAEQSVFGHFLLDVNPPGTRPPEETA